MNFGTEAMTREHREYRCRMGITRGTVQLRELNRLIRTACSSPLPLRQVSSSSLTFFWDVTGATGIDVSPARSGTVHCSAPMAWAGIGSSLSFSTFSWPFVLGRYL